MKTTHPRLMLSIKDIINITGKSRATAWRLSTAIKKRFNKGRYAYITVEEFCAFTGLKEEKVKLFLE